MAKSQKKKLKPVKTRQDFAQNAFRVMQEATGQSPKTPDPDAGKDPAAIKRGKLGGEKGGAARAKALSASRRKTIAKKAAHARWGN